MSQLPAQDSKPRGKQQTRRDNSDARIIAAAIELFANQGYQKTTLIQVGHAAGYTGTLISNRFGSKDGLLRAVIAHVLRRFRSEQRPFGLQPDDRPAEELLRTFVSEYLQDVAQKQSRIRAIHMIMGEALGGQPEIRTQIIKVNSVFRTKLEEHIRHGVQTGAFRADIDVENAAIIIVGLLRGVTSQFLTEPRTVKIIDLIPPVQASVFSILRAE